MNEAVLFSNLKVGQQVKVEGHLDENGQFLALEVSTRVSDEFSSVIGRIEDIDYEKKTVRIFNREYKVNDEVAVKNLLRLDAKFEDLQPEAVVKVKGAYSSNKGLEPHLLKMKEAFNYDVGKLKGNVEQIDQDKQQFRINGFTVQVSERTVIEGI